MKKSESKGVFSSRLGFVLTSAGAAVGLGNIWRFPYLVTAYGGGSFLAVYLLIALTLGFSLVVCEIAIGRKTGKSALLAFGSLDKRFKFVGVLNSIVPLIILPYYSIVGGWIIKYSAEFILGRGAAVSSPGFFSDFTSNNVVEPLLLSIIFITVSAVVVMLGVQRGIETVSKIIMPSLILLILFLTVYTVIRSDHGTEGIIYYIKPNLSSITVKTVIAAMGQVFYSMSIATGTFITFGSYMKRQVNIEKSVHQIEFFDTGVAFLSGLLVISALFSYYGTAEGIEAGKGLLFTSLPRIFINMPYGNVVGTVFFVMVFFAAITSSIALIEAVVSFLIEGFHLKRPIACLVVLALVSFMAVPCAFSSSLLSGINILGLSVLDFFDFFSNNILLPIVALLTAVFVGYVITPRAISREVEISSKFKSRRLFGIIIRLVAPLSIVIILVSSILGVFGIVNI